MKLLETGGLILGMFPQAVYEQETLVLDPGDLLVMYTDGVTEALNPAGEEFGEGRVRSCVDANRHRPPVELLDCLLSEVRGFAAAAAAARRRDGARAALRNEIAPNSWLPRPCPLLVPARFAWKFPAPSTCSIS